MHDEENLCTLPHNFNVNVTCLGPEDCIDGIKSAWVEILLPKYLWTNSDPEFGWIFRGYLKDYYEGQSYTDIYFDELSEIPGPLLCLQKKFTIMKWFITLKFFVIQSSMETW